MAEYFSYGNGNVGGYINLDKVCKVTSQQGALESGTPAIEVYLEGGVRETLTGADARAFLQIIERNLHKWAPR